MRSAPKIALFDADFAPEFDDAFDTRCERIEAVFVVDELESRHVLEQGIGAIGEPALVGHEHDGNASKIGELAQISCDDEALQGFDALGRLQRRIFGQREQLFGGEGIEADIHENGVDLSILSLRSLECFDRLVRISRTAQGA